MAKNLRRDQRAQSTVRLAAFFSIEALVVNALSVPQIFKFDFWALSDQGANLTAQYLIGRGLRPALDFGYHYGLLPLLLGRVWFALVGASVISCWIAMAILGLLVAVALARFAAALELGTVGIVFLCAAIPYAIQTNGPNLAHPLEAALLANGLAEQAAGRRGRALAFATAACFAKPSMGYVYGLLLVCLAAREMVPLGRLRPAAIWSFLLPSLITGIGLGSLLAASYGPAVLVRTLLPLSGLHAYQALNFGFLRAGHNFWHPPGARIGYYAGTVAGLWIVGTLWLFACSAVAALGSSGESRLPVAVRTTEMIVSCALLHAAFIVVLWGNAFCWFFYFYVLAMGIAATTMMGVLARRAAWVLIVVAIVGLKATATALGRLWIGTAPSVETAGLWAPLAEREEWTHALQIAASGPAVLLEEAGCAELEFPVLAKPVTLFLWPGLASDKDLRRKNVQLAAARWIVLPIEQPLYEGFPENLPQLARTLSNFHSVWAGHYFAVYERSRREN